MKRIDCKKPHKGPDDRCTNCGRPMVWKFTCWQHKPNELRTISKHRPNKLVIALFAAHGIPEPKAEYQFAPPRKWRFDYCWPEQKIALECDGGIWTRGRHVRGQGFLNDCEKLNTACVLGYRVFRCTPQQLESGEICEVLRQVLRPVKGQA